MTKRHILFGLSAVAALATASFLSGCGGGGGSTLGGTLTGSAAIGGSAVSRVAGASIANLQNQLNRIRPAQGSANLITRGRQGLAFDEELGLYYRYRSDSTGVWIELFEDSAGQIPAGGVICREFASSYETIIDIQKGNQRQQAYFRLTETNDPERLKLRARYEDLVTGERKSIEGDLIVQPVPTPLQEDGDEDFEDDWTGEFDWWNNEDDFYYGDDYFGEEDEFFNEDDFFRCPDEEDNPNFESVDDFEVVAFEGVITYEGCGKQLIIENAQLNYITGQFTGNVATSDGFTGSIDYNYETERGQMTLTNSSGQTIVLQFNGDIIEARYSDGRIERVNVNQWANPCAGVPQQQSALPMRSRSMMVSVGKRA
ncbi:MAG: hypothetical protein ACUVV1_04200 [Fimbriimonadales bacterium]